MIKTNINFQARLKHKTVVGAVAGIVFVAICLIWLFSTPRNGFEAAHEEISQLALNVRNHYKIRPDYWGLNNESALKNKVVPQQMIQGQKIFSRIGREVIIGQDDKGNMIMPGMRNFTITISNLSKSACIELASKSFSSEEHLGLLTINISTPEQSRIFEWGGEYSLPITQKTAETSCQNQNSISWTFE